MDEAGSVLIAYGIMPLSNPMWGASDVLFSKYDYSLSNNPPEDPAEVYTVSVDSESGGHRRYIKFVAVGKEQRISVSWSKNQSIWMKVYEDENPPITMSGNLLINENKPATARLRGSFDAAELDDYTRIAFAWESNELRENLDAGVNIWGRPCIGPHHQYPHPRLPSQ